MCIQILASFTGKEMNSAAFSITLNELEDILSHSSWRMAIIDVRKYNTG